MIKYNFMSFFKKIIWFLIRPKYYHQFFSLFLKKLNLYFNKSQENITLMWCQENSLSTSEALYEITKNSKFVNLKDKFSELYKIADEKVAKCPVKMGGEC